MKCETWRYLELPICGDKENDSSATPVSSTKQLTITRFAVTSRHLVIAPVPHAVATSYVFFKHVQYLHAVPNNWDKKTWMYRIIRGRKIIR